MNDRSTSRQITLALAMRAALLGAVLLAIELLLARDVLATAPLPPALGAGAGAVLRTVEEAVAAAEPYPDAVHRALRERFPDRPVTRDR